MQVKRDDQTSNTVSINVAPRAPRIIAVVNTDNVRVDASHPAHAGDVLVIYAIGLGATDPVVPTGAAAPGTEPLARVTAPATVNFGTGIAGKVQTPFFMGLSPGYAGLYQVNVQVPDGYTGTVYLSVTFPDAASNPVPIVIQ